MIAMGGGRIDSLRIFPVRINYIKQEIISRVLERSVTRIVTNTTQFHHNISIVILVFNFALAQSKLNKLEV